MFRKGYLQIQAGKCRSGNMYSNRGDLNIFSLKESEVYHQQINGLMISDESLERTLEHHLGTDLEGHLFCRASFEGELNHCPFQMRSYLKEIFLRSRHVRRYAWRISEYFGANKPWVKWTMDRHCARPVCLMSLMVPSANLSCTPPTRVMTSPSSPLTLCSVAFYRPECDNILDLTTCATCNLCHKHPNL